MNNYNLTLQNWQGIDGSTLILSALDYSAIGFHDLGSRVDFIRAGGGTIQLGYDGGFGQASIGLPNGVWNSIGNVGIGTTDTHGFQLAVAGNAIVESITVKLKSAWPDYVFKPAYHLPALASVKAYIDKNQHLPEMPSDQEVAKQGVNLGEMNRLLLKKVEELTLYLIKKDEQLRQMNVRLKRVEQKQRKTNCK